METTTRMGIYLFLGLVVGAVVGRWGFGYPVVGAILGGLLFVAAGFALDKRNPGKEG